VRIHFRDGTVEWIRDLDAGKPRESVILEPEQLATIEYQPKRKTATLVPARAQVAWFADFVRRQFLESPLQGPEGRELIIDTTLDTLIQRSAERALAAGLKGAPAPDGVLITLEPETGAVKAMAATRRYDASDPHPAADTRRRAGALFQPFVYATAMSKDRGPEALTPATLLDDSPVSIVVGQSKWEPQNTDRRFHGTVSVREAVAQGYNIPVVRAAVGAGLINVAETAKRFGAKDPVQPRPSLALGDFTTTPLDAASAYAALARMGEAPRPNAIRSFSRGDITWSPPKPDANRVTAPAVAYLLNNMLAALPRGLLIQRSLAGMASLRPDDRDAWIVDYSPKLLSLLWIGFEDERPVGTEGIDACFPVWSSHMKRIAAAPAAPWPVPSDVVEETIDPSSGQVASDRCPQKVREIFIQGTEPKSFCPLHATGDERASLDAPPPIREADVTRDANGVYSAVPPGGTQPEELDRVIPSYPRSARQKGISGPVVVRGIVRKNGTIDQVEVIKGLPEGLSEAAREAVAQWRFRPATYQGNLIEVYYTVTVNFRLEAPKDAAAPAKTTDPKQQEGVRKLLKKIFGDQ